MSINIASSYTAAKRLLVRLAFISMRERFYKELAMLLEVGIPLHDALVSMRDSAIKYQGIFKENWAKIQVLEDCLYRLSIGHSSLADLLCGYISERDLMMLSNAKGRLAQAIDSILYLTSRFASLKKEIIKFSLAPIAALLIVVGMIYGCQYYLFPNLLNNFELADLPTDTQALYYFTSGFVHHIGVIGMVALLLVIGVSLSLKRLTGQVRKLLDFLMPFSIYKRIIGISFLLSLSELIGTQTPFDQSIGALRQGASRYVEHFLNEILCERSYGAGVGQALIASNLLPKAMSASIEIFAKAQKVKEGLHYLAHKGLDQELVKLKTIFILIAAIGVLLSIGFGLWAFFSIGSIANALQSQITH